MVENIVAVLATAPSALGLGFGSSKNITNAIMRALAQVAMQLPLISTKEKCMHGHGENGQHETIREKNCASLFD